MMEACDWFNGLTTGQAIKWGHERMLDIYEDSTHETMKADWCETIINDMRDLLDAEDRARTLTAQRDDLLAALEAIEARAEGEWDHPSLVVCGELSTNAAADMLRFARAAIAAAKGEA